MVVAALGATILLFAACSTDNTSRPKTTTTRKVATTTTAPPSTTGKPVGPTGRFTIVGRDIVDPDGNRFYPVGANVAVRIGGFENGYAFNWNGTGTDHAADAKAWGWNVVRATLICLPEGSPNAQELDDGIDAFIREYTALKIVVMVECHDVTGDSLAPTDARIQALNPFWDRLATTWKDNPYVWFNPYNEPQAEATPADVANWLELQRNELQRLRAIAPTNVFVADIPGGAQAVQTFTGPSPIQQLGTGQCNVLYSWHAYGALGADGTFGKFADYGNEAATKANHREALEYLKEHDIPIVIGELGDPLTLDEGTAGQPIWNRLGAYAVMEAAPANEIGLIWWHATGDSGAFLTYSLMADRHAAPWSAATTGEGLSDAGKKFWEISQHPPDLGPFTGDLASSNCP